MPANLGPSHDSPEDALQRLAEAFPQAITDGKVDLERLKQALGEHVETGRERYGLTWPGKAEAIKAATINAATLLGIEKETGTLEVGKSADIIAVDGDPLADVRVLKAMKFVMARGEVIRAD